MTVSTSSLSDQELLLKIYQSDEDSFKELYSRYHLPLFNYLIRLVHQIPTAEDLLQETFLAVWQGAENFRGKSSVKTWMFRIAYHKAISWLRKQGRDRQRSEDIDKLPLYSQDVSPEEAAIQKGQIAQIQTAIEQLSPNHRSTVELTFVHGFSYKEIAEIMRCPIGTVKSRMSYALQNLNADLTRKGSG